VPREQTAPSRGAASSAECGTLPGALGVPPRRSPGGGTARPAHHRPAAGLCSARQDVPRQVALGYLPGEALGAELREWLPTGWLPGLASVGQRLPRRGRGERREQPSTGKQPGSCLGGAEAAPSGGAGGTSQRHL